MPSSGFSRRAEILRAEQRHSIECTGILPHVRSFHRRSTRASMKTTRSREERAFRDEKLLPIEDAFLDAAGSALHGVGSLFLTRVDGFHLGVHDVFELVELRDDRIGHGGFHLFHEDH